MKANSGFAASRAAPEPGGGPVLDDYPTPPWATRALLRFLRERGEPLHLQTAWEPACNRGYMARVLAEEFDSVYATDVKDYDWPGQSRVLDFTEGGAAAATCIDWIVTNPPFIAATDFAREALRGAGRGVALLTRLSFIEGCARFDALFRDHPEAFVLPFVERVVMWRGALLDPDVPVWRVDPKTGEGALRRPSTAAAYAWLVWTKPAPADATRLCRIPPCRRDLTRTGDYPPLPACLRHPDDREAA